MNKNIVSKILAISGLVAVAFLMFGSFVAPAHAQLTTSTLGSSIDNVNSTWYSYFVVMLAHYWPFVVGVIILLIVWRFGKGTLFGLR